MDIDVKKNELSKKIEKIQSRDDKKTRDYIGASAIGSDCLRQIWYEFKGYQGLDVPTKTRRTWAIGKHLEGLILNWIEETGIKIERTWYDLSAEDMPYFQGHLDSVWMKKEKPFAIIEIKTAKDASFMIFIKKGLKGWNPQYYAQVQSYMGMSGIHKAYILVLNKDNSDISDELVTFDKVFYEQICRKAFLIANIEEAPARVHDSPLWFQCKMCKFNKVCHK
jgi:hypothetical protein